MQEKRLRIGHEKEIMNQGNDGYAHQQHGGTRQELPEIIHRGVGEITDGHPREHESLFGEILFAPREKKGHQEGENTHKQKKLHNIREQRIQEDVEQPRKDDPARKGENLRERFVLPGHDADHAEQDGQFQKGDGVEPRRIEQYPQEDRGPEDDEHLAHVGVLLGLDDRSGPRLGPARGFRRGIAPQEGGGQRQQGPGKLGLTPEEALRRQHEAAARASERLESLFVNGQRPHVRGFHSQGPFLSRSLHKIEKMPQFAKTGVKIREKRRDVQILQGDKRAGPLALRLQKRGAAPYRPLPRPPVTVDLIAFQPYPGDKLEGRLGHVAHGHVLAVHAAHFLVRVRHTVHAEQRAVPLKETAHVASQRHQRRARCEEQGDGGIDGDAERCLFGTIHRQIEGVLRLLHPHEHNDERHNDGNEKDVAVIGIGKHEKKHHTHVNRENQKQRYAFLHEE